MPKIIISNKGSLKFLFVVGLSFLLTSCNKDIFIRKTSVTNIQVTNYQELYKLLSTLPATKTTNALDTGTPAKIILNTEILWPQNSRRQLSDSTVITEFDVRKTRHY